MNAAAYRCGIELHSIDQRSVEIENFIKFSSFNWSASLHDQFSGSYASNK